MIMPELPDLEILREQFQVLCCDIITSVQVLFPVTFRVLIRGTPQELLSNQSVRAVKRRGKFLIFALDDLYLVFNLMLTGRLILTQTVKKNRTTVAVFQFSSGFNLQFDDFKKMGKVYLTGNLEEIPQYPHLGVEPLSLQFTVHMLSQVLEDSRALKIVLTDQRLIAGIGNAYADEILFQASLNPLRKASTLTAEEVSVLHDSVIYTLENAIEEIRKAQSNKKSEIRDFLSVHGKKGQSCPACGSIIREIMVGRRVTHVCPHCQKVNLLW